MIELYPFQTNQNTNFYSVSQSLEILNIPDFFAKYNNSKAVVDNKVKKIYLIK